MRTGGALFDTTHLSRNTAAAATNTAKATFSPPAAQRSPWHSPVPYLFGGLAAMLGLIAFALLILACSYWKLSGHVEDGEGDAENRKGESSTEDKASHVFEEKYLVIIAGEVRPTFLATPMSRTGASHSLNDDHHQKLSGKETDQKTKNPLNENQLEETDGPQRSQGQTVP